MGAHVAMEMRRLPLALGPHRGVDGVVEPVVVGVAARHHARGNGQQHAGDVEAGGWGAAAGAGEGTGQHSGANGVKRAGMAVPECGTVQRASQAACGTVQRNIRAPWPRIRYSFSWP